MTTSNYMPDVKVEIAFNAGYNTPTASRIWTDVSSYVELDDKIQISRGRADEFGTADPNKLTLTLDNRDGRFTAGRAASPYFPNVKIGRPIKVTSTPVGGTASIRFLGYVDEWPVEWAGSDAYAMAKITASSRMARLGIGATMLNMLGEEIVHRSGAAHYYPLGEPEGSTRAQEMITSQELTSVGAPPTFGGATGLPDGSTGFVFQPSPPLPPVSMAGKLTNMPSWTDAPDGITIECYIFAPAPNVSSPPLFNVEDIVFLFGEPQTGAHRSELNLDLSDPGRALAAIQRSIDAGSGSATTPVGVNIRDGKPHHILGQYQNIGGNTVTKFYLDGVLVGTTSYATGAAVLDPMTNIEIGHLKNSARQDDVVISHVVIGGSLAHLPTRLEAMRTGFADDDAAERIVRYASYAGIDPAEVSADPSTYSVPEIDTAGKTVLEAMRVVEQGEDGLLFDSRDNILQFRGRRRRYNAPIAFTLSVAAQQVEAGLTPKLDRTTMTNEVVATAADGSIARVKDQASIDAYGYARTALETGRTYDDAYQAATWRILTHAEPQPRIPSLSVNLLPLSASLQASLMAADIGTRMGLSGMPSQASASSLDFFIEGYTETIDVESYAFDFNVSPATGYDGIFTLDDAVMGAIGSSYRLAY